MFAGDGRQPLHAASAGGFSDCATLLLRWGANLDTRFMGETPEELARRLGYFELARDLALAAAAAAVSAG
jgi:ankyrin repeat protein